MISRRTQTLLFAVFLVATSSYLNAFDVGQIHLSFSGVETGMSIDFVASDEVSYVEYSKVKTPNKVTSILTDSECVTNIGWLHNTELSSLEPNEEYHYRIGSGLEEEWSDWISFRAGYPKRDNGSFGRRGDDNSAQSQQTGDGVAAVYADFGLNNDVSMDRLTVEAKFNVFDYALHIGDLAYNLFDNDSAVGNEFMDLVSDFSKNKPLMVAAGNHEAGDNFDEYVKRFRSIEKYAGIRSFSNTNFYYSFNVGLIHYIVINTEIYKYPTQTMASPFPFTAEDQLNWLEADLIKANENRQNVPWIVMMGHKGWYMNEFGDFRVNGDITTNFTGFDYLGCKYGVDLYLTGHVHIYQRFLPVLGPRVVRFMAPPVEVDDNCVSEDGHTYTNPKFMPTIVVGSPGNQDFLPRVICPAMEVADRIFWGNSQVLCSADYGFGHLQAVNSTHLYWEFVITEKAPSVNDTELSNQEIKEELHKIFSHRAVDTISNHLSSQDTDLHDLIFNTNLEPFSENNALKNKENLMINANESNTNVNPLLKDNSGLTKMLRNSFPLLNTLSETDASWAVKEGRVVRDHLWIVQEKHGMRDYCDV